MGLILKHFIIITLACAVSKVNYWSGGNLKSLDVILPLITIMTNEGLKHIFQSWKRERWLTKASGPLRQAQGPGYGGSRPSFPRRRESIETSCQKWIPAFARITKGLGWKKIR